MSFAETLGSLDADQPLSPDAARDVVKELVSELNSVIIGQQRLTRRVVQAAILNGHVLIESLPGEGKTKLARTFSERIGMRFKRIQFLPDMMPSDIIGRRMLVFDEDGTAELKWVPGPIYHPVILADEINRAPPKVQAAMLESMEERTCTRIDEPRAETVYPRVYRKYLDDHKDETCFGLKLPSSTDRTRVPFIVLATQNPIEMEGTYPLAEAQTDRFLFKEVLYPPGPDTFDEIVRVNVPPVVDNTYSFSEPDLDAEPADAKGIPLWVKSACLLEWVRNEIISRAASLHNRLLEEQRGLWDRVRLIVWLSHYRPGERDALAGAAPDILPAPLRDEHQQRILQYLAVWRRSPPSEAVRDAVMDMLSDPLFQYVESGTSRRGLIEWPRAAAVEAFLGNAPDVTRWHFRETALDVLRHRIRLTPQARAEGIRHEDVLYRLVDTLLPLKEEPGLRLEDDKTPLIST